MDPEILKRYDLTVDNQFIVPVNLPDYSALYEKFDYFSSFYKRDLNQKLVEYLLYCARELGSRNDFILRIDLPVVKKSEPDENDMIFSIKKYFEYEISLCRYEIKSAITRLIFHFAIAVGAFLTWLIIISAMPESSTAVYQFFSDGLSVGIWVLLLIGISRFLFRYQTQTTIIRLCKKISISPVEFNYINGTNA
ncbi:hypothetical protein D1BOALGB6SA_3894 [Olavius sp. associated proteobacterium Delta 1]|nr:hypothetical protein D1BOALGB6SA_3894 [Olavius sp. associated proteobacterium Delta 1]